MKLIKESLILDNPDCERIDALLAQYYEDYSRTYFQELIESEQVLLNGKPLKKRQIPLTGDQVDITFKKRPGPDLTPQAIPLNILYEDHHLLAVNKPAHMVVHPAPGNWSNTFVNALLNHCELENTCDTRPGIVHRLDKETSGVLLAAKTEACHQKLIELFQTRAIEKEYHALVCGRLTQQVVHLPLKRSEKDRKKMTIAPKGEGKEALTEFIPLEFNGTFTKVLIKPKTGRTHQIRVHLAHLGFPVLGDKLYGHEGQNARYKVDRQLLHASALRLTHPMTGQLLELFAPLPKEMESLFICGF